VGKAIAKKRSSRRKALQRDSKVNSPELSRFLRINSRSDQERDTVRKKLQFWRESSAVPASAVGVSTPSPTSSSSASASASAVAPPAQEEEQHEEEQHEEEHTLFLSAPSKKRRVCSAHRGSESGRAAAA
jgi:hypothetical protein